MVEMSRLPVRSKLPSKEDARPEDLIVQSMAFTDRQHGSGVVDLAGADIEQRVRMGDWNVGQALGLAVRTDRLENQQASDLVEPDPGGAVPLHGKEALDVTQPAPLTPDQAGERWSEGESGGEQS